MYRRKHKRKLRFARLVVILALIAGGVWFFYNGGSVNRFAVKPGEIGKSLGSVLGMQLKRVSNRAAVQLKEVGERGNKSKSQKQKSKASPRIVLKIGIVSDSHEDTNFFPKILSQIKKAKVDLLIHLGDLSNGGEIDKLREAKTILDQSGLPYIALPGDHDYNWRPEHNLKNFSQVFKEPENLFTNQVDWKLKTGSWGYQDGFYFELEYKGITLIFLDTSDNQNAISSKQTDWLTGVLEDAKRMESKMPTFILTQAPLYSSNFPSKQAPGGANLLNKFSGFKIDQVFSGNTHSFALYPDPKTGIEMATVGAVGSYKNLLPLWTLVKVHEDGSFEVESRLIKSAN